MEQRDAHVSGEVLPQFAAEIWDQDDSGISRFSSFVAFSTRSAPFRPSFFCSLFLLRLLRLLLFKFFGCGVSRAVFLMFSCGHSRPGFLTHQPQNPAFQTQKTPPQPLPAKTRQSKPFPPWECVLWENFLKVFLDK
jgi:hypothetical protein